ncbi:minor capsid protein [Melissococcus plutonius]|uniref:minor capsid protein n=1 Tax=Melissococcus plutonius TaxID=33970 RepID=UPI0021E54E35|nr:minor capsid protein [Melissococcus plutonius]MCV2505655.1 minor capsid protein [Melissococcus plutonius]
MMPKIPKRFCQQTIIFKQIKQETNDWNQPDYEEAITIQNVLFQPQTIYSGENNNRQIIANAVVYFFAGISKPLPKLNKEHVGSKIDFEGKEYTVKVIVDNRNPFSNNLYSYELEVL